MLRNEMFPNRHWKEENQEEPYQNKVIFLDIDGVLQPLGSQRRFDHDMEATREYLAELHDNPCFLDIHEIDLGAAFYDWNFIALGILHQLIEENHCSIVVHSDWKVFQTFEKLKALFQIYGLDERVIGVTDKGDKGESIKKYLSEHPEIKQYVVIDDDKRLLYDFGWRFCLTHNIMTTQDYEQCNSILQCQFHVEQVGSVINCYLYDKIYWCFSCKEIEVKDLKIWILPLIESERHINSYLLRCVVNELIKYLCESRPELSGIIFLERDWQGSEEMLRKLGIYDELIKTYYIPTQKDVSFFSIKIRDYWREIEQALKTFDLIEKR